MNADVIERTLGDPFSPDATCSFEKVLERDESEVYWHDLITQLAAERIQHQYVPAALGGTLRDLQELSLIGWSLARRDIGLAISHGISFLAGAQIWINGTGSQQRALADSIISGNIAALCITEEHAGSDLTMTNLQAERNGSNYTLHGEKHLINNAGRADLAVILCRSQGSKAGDVDGLVLALVDLTEGRALGRVEWRRIPLHIVRTAEIGNLRLRGISISRSGVLAEGKAALTALLKGFQISKIMITSLGLGAFDLALRMVIRETTERRLYGAPITNLPPVRELTVRSYLRYLGAQCLVRLSLLGCVLNPTTVWARANACKAYAGTALESAAAELASAMGTRAFVRTRAANGMFEKIRRDLAFPRQIHSSAIVCLDHLTTGLSGAGLLSPSSSTQAKPGHLLVGSSFELGEITCTESMWSDIDLKPRLTDPIFALIANSALLYDGRGPHRVGYELTRAHWLLWEAMAKWSQQCGQWLRRRKRNDYESHLNAIRLAEDYCGLLAGASVLAHAARGVFSERLQLNDGIVALLFCQLCFQPRSVLAKEYVDHLMAFLLAKREWNQTLCILVPSRDGPKTESL